MEPLIVCAGIDRGKLLRLSFLASALGIRVKAAEGREQGQTVGALCGVDPAVNGSSGAIDGEMLVMAFFSDALMDRFLKALRDSGDTVALKAVLMPYNRAWRLDRLYRELKAEAAAMQGGKRP